MSDDLTKQLFDAADSGYIDVVTDLLSKGADPNALSEEDFFSPLSCECRRSVLASVCAHFRRVEECDDDDDDEEEEKGAEKKPKQKRDYLAVVSALIAAGAKPNMAVEGDGASCTPLQISVALSGDPDLVKTLLPHLSADEVSAVSEMPGDWTPVCYSSRNLQHETARALLSVPGVDVNKQTGRGWSALQEVCANCESVEMLKILLDAPGVDVNIAMKDEDDPDDPFTPLQLVLQNIGAGVSTSVEFVTLLLAAGARVEEKDVKNVKEHKHLDKEFVKTVLPMLEQALAARK